MSSDFVRQPLMKKLNKKNPMSRIEKLEANKARPSQRVEAVSEVAQSAGTILGSYVLPYPVPNSAYVQPLVSDFIQDDTNEPFAFNALSGGTFARATDTTDGHHGIIAISSAASSDTGVYVRPNYNVANGRIYESFVFETFFKFTAPSSDTAIVQAGWLDSLTVADPTDGIYVNFDSAGGATPAVFSAGVLIASPSFATGTQNFNTEWQKLRIESTPDSLVVFTLSSRTSSVFTASTEVSAALTLTAQPMFKCWKQNSGAVQIAQLDYISVCQNPNFSARW